MRAQHRVFDRLVYAKLRAALGGECVYAVSGGAPLGERLGHFYRGIGVNVLEGYGLTETTAALTANLPDAQKVGTVGRPLQGTSVRVADDGELLFRGGQVFAGYWHNDEATAEAMDAQGWFHTGDVGEIDDEGFVRITGRKKEILVTAGGKNVAPAVLEDRLRAHRLVDQCIVVGDGQPFIAALVTIDPETLPDWAERHGKSGDVADLVDDPDLRAEIEAAVEEANKAVSKAESIRRFAILPERLDRGGRSADPEPQAQAGRGDARAPRRGGRPLRPLSAQLVTLCDQSRISRTKRTPLRHSGSAVKRSVVSRCQRGPWDTNDPRAPRTSKGPPFMDRRKALLLVAAVIAAVGTLLVFLYVRGADTRADQRYDAVQVLRVVKPIAAGETVEAAQSAGKIESSSVSKKDLLPDALTGTEPIAGKVAVTNIYPGEQLIASKFGATGSTNGLAIPKGKIAISVNLSDPSRVAGFVNPGDKVAIFMTRGTFTRLLLPSVQVIGAGTTTVTTTTTTDASGAQSTEQLPKTLLTLAVSQADAEKVLFASSERRPRVRPAQRRLAGGALPGRHRPEPVPLTPAGPRKEPHAHPRRTRLHHRRRAQLGGAGWQSRSSPAPTRSTAGSTDAGSTRSCIGPTLDLPAAAALAERVRTGHPGTSIVLARLELEPQVYAQAMQAGIGAVVAADDHAALGTAVARARSTWEAIHGPTVPRRESATDRSSWCSRPRAVSARPRWPSTSASRSRAPTSRCASSTSTSPSATSPSPCS